MLLPIDGELSYTDPCNNGVAPDHFVAPEMQDSPSAGLSFGRGPMQSFSFIERAWHEVGGEVNGEDTPEDELERIKNILMYESPTNSPGNSPANSPNTSPYVPAQAGAQLGEFMLPPSMANTSSNTTNASSMFAETSSTLVPQTTTPILHAPPTAAAGPPQRTPYIATKRPVAVRTFRSTSEVSVTAGGVAKKPHFISSAPPIDEDLIRRGSEAAKLQQDDAEVVRDLKRINRQSRAFQHQRNPWSGPKPTPRNRGARWGQLRYNQILHLSKYLRKDEMSYGFLEPDMQKLTCKLALMAVGGVLATENNHLLRTASAPVWAFALAQEAWQRMKTTPGWHAESQDAADMVSWDSLELTYTSHLVGFQTFNPEVHHDEEKEKAKSKKQTEEGVWRRVVSHSLGKSHEKVEEKMKCLDKMLRLGGDAYGIHWQIQKQMRPDVLRYGASDGNLSALQKAKISASASWGKQKRKERGELTNGEAHALAQVAADLAGQSKGH